jgi:membrane-bound lytic murein transglycosylase B
MRKFMIKIFSIVFLLWTTASLGSNVLSAGFCQSYANQADVRSFITHMVKQHGFDEQELTHLFCCTTPLAPALSHEHHPYEKNTWNRYREIFITKQKVANGVIYWKKHKKALANAEKKYGVPANIIVAIVGIESNYGSFNPPYPVLNALVTQSFFNALRASFFQNELEQYLLLARAMKIDPTLIKGSYSGAMGLPQFMPSNYLRFGVSTHAHKMPDLLHDTNDVIYSIANYLKEHGWQKNKLIVMRAKTKRNIPISNSAILFELENEKSNEYWLGFNNFQTILKYNASILYGMAVVELGKSIKTSL